MAGGGGRPEGEKAWCEAYNTRERNTKENRGWANREEKISGARIYKKNNDHWPLLHCVFSILKHSHPQAALDSAVWWQIW